MKRLVTYMVVFLSLHTVKCMEKEWKAEEKTKFKNNCLLINLGIDGTAYGAPLSSKYYREKLEEYKKNFYRIKKKKINQEKYKNSKEKVGVSPINDLNMDDISEKPEQKKIVGKTKKDIISNFTLLNNNKYRCIKCHSENPVNYIRRHFNSCPGGKAQCKCGFFSLSKHAYKYNVLVQEHIEKYKNSVYHELIYVDLSLKP